VTGLRERKKQQTRQEISDAAFELFATRGFEQVTVAEVARRAGVSEATVFNYFATKEDLAYSRMEAFEDELLAAIRDRAPGQSILDAFRVFITRPRGLVAAKDSDAAARLATVTRVVTGSRSLLNRERQVYDQYTRALAGLIAEEMAAKPADITPWVVANALIGVQRALVDFVRAQVLAGRAGPGLARRVRAQAERALGVLEAGFASIV
jgi:AcrR family transcriptional regulator